MDTLLQQVLVGLSTGSIYAGLALALVMIYQSTHLVNFAQGEMAVLSTYLCWSLLHIGIPYWGAFALTLVASVAIGMAIERTLIRPLRNAPMLSVVIAFIALLLIVNSLVGWIFGYDVRAMPSPFPSTPMFGGLVSAHQVGALGMTIVMLVSLYAFFRYTPLGLAMRAAARNPVSARLVGIRVGWMLGLGWGLAAAIGAVAGMMISPSVYLEPNMMSAILLYAFAGALLGGIDSPLGAVIGGLLVGVIENLAGTYLIGTELKLAVALLLIVGVLVVKPSGLMGRTVVARV
jgi:branched-chain amino acid transport system permease protein